MVTPHWFMYYKIKCIRIQCNLVYWEITNIYINFSIKHLFVRSKILVWLHEPMRVCSENKGNGPLLGSVLFGLLSLLYHLVCKKQCTITTSINLWHNKTLWTSNFIYLDTVLYSTVLSEIWEDNYEWQIIIDVARSSHGII